MSTATQEVKPRRSRKKPAGEKSTLSAGTQEHRPGEFSVSVKPADLARALVAARASVDDKPAVPILSSVLLSTDPGVLGSGSLRVSSTNLRLAYAGTCRAESSGRGSVCLPAKRLLEVVRRLGGEDASIRVRPGDSGPHVEVVCGRARFDLSGLGGDDFPTFPTLPREFTSLPSSVVVDLLERSGQAMSDDVTRPHLHGALLERSGKLLRLVATNGHWLALSERVVEGLGAGEDFSMLLPRDALDEVGSLVSGADSVAMGHTSSHVFFRRADDEGTALLAAPMSSAAFPPYDQVIPKKPERSVTVPRQLLVDALRRLSVMTSAQSRGLKFALDAGSVALCGEDPEFGQGTEVVDASYDGTRMSFGVSVEYMQQALACCRRDSVTLQLGGELDPILVDEVRGSDRDLAVVMPMRV